MMCRTLLIIVVAALLLETMPAAVRADPEPIIADTLKIWKVRFERFKSARYKISGTIETKNNLEISATDPDASRIVRDPSDSIKQNLQATVTIDLERKHFRIEETTQSTNHSAITKITAYNGISLQRGIVRDPKANGSQEPDINIIKGYLGNQQAADAYLFPVFMAHGIVPTVFSHLRPDRLPISNSPEDFTLSSKASLSGRECVLLRTNPTGSTPTLADEFWIDSNRDCAILRFVHWQLQTKNPFYRIDVEYAPGQGTWMPTKWIETHSIGGKVMAISHLNVDTMELNIPIHDGDFTIANQKGMRVNIIEFPEPGKGLDPYSPARSSYLTSESGRLEPIGEPTEFTTTDGVKLPPSKSSWRWMIGTGLVVALIVIVLLILGKRANNNPLRRS